MYNYIRIAGVVQRLVYGLAKARMPVRFRSLAPICMFIGTLLPINKSVDEMMFIGTLLPINKSVCEKRGVPIDIPLLFCFNL